MKYLIKQKVFSFSDTYTIYNEKEQPAFLAKFKILSLSNKFYLSTVQGEIIYETDKKIFSFLPEFYIKKYNQLYGTLKKELTFFKPKFNLVSEYGNYNLEGDFFHYNFNFYKNGNIIADINKKFFSFRDSYGVDISEEEDHAFILTNVIILDFLFHNSTRKNN